MKVIELDKQIVEHYSVVTIEEALQDLPSVVDVSFIEATAQVLVYCNDDSIDVAFLVAHLDGEVRGRTATVSRDNARVELTDAAASQEHNATDTEGIIRLSVTSMHCGSCVSIVENAIRGISGVDDVTVSLVTGQAVVSHRNVSWSSIVDALAKRGYSGELISSPHDVLRRLRTENMSGQRMWLQRWLISGAGVVLLLTLMADGIPLSPIMRWWFALFVATVVQVVVGGVYIKSASKLALNGASNMDTLIAIGTSAAYLGGLVFQETETHLLMDAPMILAFVSFGKWIEVRARQSTVDEFSRVDVMNCETSHLIVGDETQDIATSELIVTNSIIIRPGEVVPTDGRIADGESTVNQSWLTGESTPKSVETGDRIFGGSINGNGLLTLEVDVAPADNRLHKMTQVVEKSVDSRVTLQTLADRIVQRFVPILLMIGLITLVTWLVIGYGVSDSYRRDAWR